MSTPVGGENLIIEMFDSEAQPSDTNFLQSFEFGSSQSAGFAFEGDLFSITPAHMSVKAIDEIVELFFADVRGRAATEVSETKLTSLECACSAVALSFLDQGIEIEFDFAGVLVRVDFEVAKLATLTAKRYVQIKTEWIVDSRRLIERLYRFRHIFWLPFRKRRIVGNKIVPDFSSCSR